MRSRAAAVRSSDVVEVMVAVARRDAPSNGATSGFVVAAFGTIPNDAADGYDGASLFVLRETSAGSAAAPDAKTADATHANAAARVRIVHVSRSPSGMSVSEARLGAFASARGRKTRLDAARDTTRRREVTRRAPIAAEDTRA